MTDPTMLASARVREVIAKHLCRSLEEVADDATFESLDADSLDLIELELEFEDEFSITLEEGAIADVPTVGDAIAVVERALGEREAA